MDVMAWGCAYGMRKENSSKLNYLEGSNYSTSRG